MKVGIIHRDNFGYSMIVANILEDYLENNFNVIVGNARKIDPALFVEEKLDALIIGDIVAEIIPSLEIKNWLVNFSRLSRINNLHIKRMSVYCIGLTDINIEPIWNEFLQKYFNLENIYPPILHLKLSRSDLTLENEAIELIKNYSIDLMKFFIE